MFKFIGRHWQSRRERFYKKNRWHLILDFSLATIIILLVASLISLKAYQPNANWFWSGTTPTKSAIDLNNPPLIFNVSVASSSVRLTQAVELKVNLKNDSDFLIQNIKTDLVLATKNFSLNKIEASVPNSDIKISNRQIDFGSLGASAAKTITLKVYFNTYDEAERVINWQVQNSYSVEGQTIKEALNLPDLKLASELIAKAVAYYNSPQGDQLGSGPLPPLVGLPTNYWVFFDVKSNGDFKNLVFSAKLPLGVELTGERSLLSGDFKYNASSRQIIWTVPELKNQSDSYRVGFEIQLIPDSSQLGKNIPLITNISYYAQDTLVNEESAAELYDLSTNLDFDRLNKGQGKVKQP